MIGIVGILVIAVVEGVIVRDAPPPPVHLLLQRTSSEPFNQDFKVINFKIFVPKKSNRNAFHKSKVVNYKKKWNSTGMPRSFKQIFDFYRHEGNYYPNEKKITTVPPVTENTLSSVALFPASYHSEVHHDNHHDSFYDGSVVKPVAEIESEGYLDKDVANSSTEKDGVGDGGGEGKDTDDEGNKKKEETYRYFQDIYYHQKSPSQVEFGHVIDSPQRKEVHYEQKDHKNNYFTGKNIWQDDTTGKQGEQFWYSFASNNKT